MATTPLQPGAAPANPAARKAPRHIAHNRPEPDPNFRIADPATLPDIYGMICKGDCMEPDIPDGATMVFTKAEKPQVGDNVIIWFRPELVPAGETQCQLKRLVLDAWPGMTYPHKDSPTSEVVPVIIVEANNPPRRWHIKCSEILALHKCVGPLSAQEG